MKEILHTAIVIYIAGHEISAGKKIFEKKISKKNFEKKNFQKKFLKKIFKKKF